MYVCIPNVSNVTHIFAEKNVYLMEKSQKWWISEVFISKLEKPEIVWQVEKIFLNYWFILKLFLPYIFLVEK